MPEFKEGESDWFTPKQVEENDFLNDKLDTNDYGIYYSVLFEGDAETFLWQAKTAPEVGTKYYGHIEKSKSGKSMRFKKDKLPEGTVEPQGAAPTYKDNSDGITASMATKLAYHAFIQTESLMPSESAHWTVIEDNARMLYNMIGRVKSPDTASKLPIISKEGADKLIKMVDEEEE